MERELDAQRQEIARLRGELADRAVERERLGQAVEELQGLRGQVADTEAFIAERQAERVAELRSLDQAIALLEQADQVLSTSSTDVDGLLDGASDRLAGQAVLLIDAARDAINSGDLFTARIDIQDAIHFALTNQVTGSDQPISRP